MRSFGSRVCDLCLATFCVLCPCPFSLTFCSRLSSLFYERVSGLSPFACEGSKLRILDLLFARESGKHEAHCNANKRIHVRHGSMKPFGLRTARARPRVQSFALAISHVHVTLQSASASAVRPFGTNARRVSTFHRSSRLSKRFGVFVMAGCAFALRDA